MLAILGLFPFELRSAPFLSAQRDSNYKHPSNSRVNNTPAYQFTGKGEETITLSGVLYPQITGGDVNLDLLRLMADSGKAWILIEGAGKIIGMFVIENISETRTEFFDDGVAKKIDFSLKLKRVDSSKIGMLGNLLNAGMGFLA